jgi:hypothetical protein
MLTKKGFYLFIFGCVLARLALGIAAFKVHPRMLQVMGALFACTSLAMLILYFTKGRKTGPEVFGGSIWWNDHRIVHAAFYAVFAALAVQKNKHAGWALLADAMYGLLIFTLHHFVEKTDKGILFKTQNVFA